MAALEKKEMGTCLPPPKPVWHSYFSELHTPKSNDAPGLLALSLPPCPLLDYAQASLTPFRPSHQVYLLPAPSNLVTCHFFWLRFSSARPTLVHSGLHFLNVAKQILLGLMISVPPSQNVDPLMARSSHSSEMTFATSSPLSSLLHDISMGLCVGSLYIFILTCLCHSCLTRPGHNAAVNIINKQM